MQIDHKAIEQGSKVYINDVWVIKSKVTERRDSEECPHPREPLSDTPTAKIGRWEMIVICVPYTAPVFA